MTRAIYRPRGAAYEYAPLALNLYRGCAHGCRYCYGPACLRISREEFLRAAPRPGIVDQVGRDARQLQGDPRPVLLSFTSDPYQPIERNRGLTRSAILILHDHQLRIRLLTKAPALAMERDGELLAAYGVDCGVTLCWIDDHKRQAWEPGAGTVASRMEFLRWAKANGLATWVSVEPVIEPAEALGVLEATADAVDIFRIGKINHQPDLERAVNWRSFLQETLNLVGRLGAAYHIKDSLWSYADPALRAAFPQIRGLPVEASRQPRERQPTDTLFEHKEGPNEDQR